MSRAIDADALIEFIENRYDITWKEDYEGGIKDACVDILEEINKMPTIESQRKKGKWLFKERREPVYDLSGVKTWGIAYMCSECGFIHTVIEDFGQYAYCPNSNCGAEMEGLDDRI